MSWRPLLLLLRLITLLCVAAVLTSLLITYAPGAGVDEMELDARLGSESVAALRAQQAAQNQPWQYLKRLLRGELGISYSLQVPVRELFQQRLPLTARMVASGLLLSWVGAFLFALPSALGWYNISRFVSALVAALLCVPAAVLAVLLYPWASLPGLLIACVLLPRLQRQVAALFTDVRQQTHVLAARTRGLPGVVVLLQHIVVPTLPAMLALYAVSVNTALGASIPLEALAGTPGMGQLTWQAAVARDLPVLLPATLLTTAITLCANTAAELLTNRGGT